MGTAPFQQGDRIVLDSMMDDPDPIPRGTTGTVEWCIELGDASWQVIVKWNIPRSLTLIIPPDRAHKED
jgi:hypothetical protein